MKRITIETDDEHANTIMALVADKAASVSMQTIEPERGKTRRMRYGASRKAGTTAYIQLTRSLIVGQAFTIQDVERIMVAEGYKAVSASATVSTLCSTGHVERLGTGKFRLLKQVQPGERIR